MQFLKFHYAPHRSWKALATLPFLGLAMALLGPFGSYSTMDAVSRGLHFAFCFSLIGVVVLEGSYQLARRFFTGYWPVWAALLFDVAMCVPAAGAVYGSLYLFGRASLAKIGFGDLVWQNLAMLLVIRAIVVAVAVYHARQMPLAAEAERAPVAGGLDEKLPFALKGAAVVALSSEDHYLRVYTARGEALIHGTMNEGVAALGEGFQIHRSHWVASHALRDVEGERVRLVTGLSLPLSRHRRKAFEAWLVEAGITPS